MGFELLLAGRSCLRASGSAVCGESIEGTVTTAGQANPGCCWVQGAAQEQSWFHGAASSATSLSPVPASVKNVLLPQSKSLAELQQ